jgi:hypothetical protein
MRELEQKAAIRDCGIVSSCGIVLEKSNEVKTKEKEGFLFFKGRSDRESKSIRIRRHRHQDINNNKFVVVGVSTDKTPMSNSTRTLLYGV